MPETEERPILRNCLKIILSVFLGFILSAVILETGLRIAAGFRRFESGNVAITGSRGVRILCLGDSFTYGMGASSADKAYPAQLRKKFEKKGCNVVTINRGFPGNNTSIIRDRLENDILKYKPDVILLMAGINNTWNETAFRIDEGNTREQRIRTFLYGFRTYKLFRIISYNLSAGARRDHAGKAEDGDDFRANSQRVPGTRFPDRIRITENGVESSIRLKIHDYGNSGKMTEVAVRTHDSMVYDFGKINQIAEYYGVKVVFMTYPGMLVPNTYVMEAALKNKYPLIDNMTDFLGSIPEEKMPEYFSKDNPSWRFAHPDDKGYEKMAEYVANELPKYEPSLKKCSIH